MKIKRFVASFVVGVAVLCGATSSAWAIYFSDFVYQNARNGRTAAIETYLKKGYDIDAVNPRGMTALCLAVSYKDFRAYKLLRNMGANPKKYCMERVDNNVKDVFEDKYVTGGVYVTRSAQPVAEEAKGNNISQYVAGGVLAAGLGTAAVLLWNDDDDDSSSSSKPVTPADPDTPEEITCPEGQELVGNECRPIVCPEGQELVGNECRPIVCPEGTHLEGNECVSDVSCPEGEVWNGTACEQIVCPEGAVLVGNECVCPTGTRLENGVCTPIVCPENTHLVGNLCVADTVDIENTNPDEDFYGIRSDKESVFNLYSSPKYPDDRASIVLKNTGDKNVYGMYGYGGEAEVFNSYVIGYDGNGNNNEKSTGIGSITITNEGSGIVYGMYSQISDITQYKEAINASGWNNGVAYGSIDIEHTGGGETYGVFGDVRAYNTFTAYGGQAYGDISIVGDGNIYGVSGYVAATNALSAFFGSKVIGNISLTGTGGDIYGMMVNKDDIPGAGTGGGNIQSWFAFNAYGSGGDVQGNITIKQSGNGNVYGMYGGQQLFNAMSYGGVDDEGNPNSLTYGKISINNKGNGNSFGMYLPEADKEGIVANINENGSHSNIQIINHGSGTATGMRGGEETRIINSGEISINNLGSGTAIGIYGEKNSKIDNSGTIDIYRQGYQENSLWISPDSEIGGTAYGIYAESGAQVNNSGVIKVSGAGAGQGIYLEDGATLENNGTVIFNGTEQNVGENSGASVGSGGVNFDELGGSIVLGEGGKFFADRFAGGLGISDNTVLGSFKDEYVLNGALQAEDVSDLSVYSKSALFDVNVRANAKTGFDVVLERRNFGDFIDNKSLAQFLEKNYAQKNSVSLYDVLKKQETAKSVTRVAANLGGSDMLPSFRREDAYVYGQLSRQFDDNLFNRPDENYIGGYKFIDISRDADGTLTGSEGRVNAAYGMAKRKWQNGFVLGVGANVFNLKNDYDNGASRKGNAVGVWMPAGYDFSNGLRWYSKLYAGYVDGSYDRKTPLATYSADITEYQYGLSNEVRHSIGLGGGVKFEPLAALNFLGIHYDGFDEGDQTGALHTDGNDSLSLEGGLGVYLTKEFLFDENNKLTVQIGGIYYVEFLDPDEGFDTSMRGMSGKYKISHKTNDSRAVFSARVNYSYKDVTLYGVLEQETGDNKAFNGQAGLEYKF